MSETRDGTVGEVIDGRVSVYGDPKETFGRIAQMWSALFGFEVHDWQVPLAMQAMKMIRTTQAPDYSDNTDDIEGYLDIFRQLIGEDMVHARSVTEYLEKRKERGTITPEQVARADYDRLTDQEIDNHYQETLQMLRVPSGPFGDLTTDDARRYWMEMARLHGISALVDTDAVDKETFMPILHEDHVLKFDHRHSRWTCCAAWEYGAERFEVERAKQAHFNHLVALKLVEPEPEHIMCSARAYTENGAVWLCSVCDWVGRGDRITAEDLFRQHHEEPLRHMMKALPGVSGFICSGCSWNGGGSLDQAAEMFQLHHGFEEA